MFFRAVLNQIVSRSVFDVLISSGLCVVVINDFPSFKNCPG